MAKKNGEKTGVEEEAPVFKANPLEERLNKQRDERRTFEAELATIDAEVRQAINDGNLEALDRLSARKAELPRLYIQASTGEMAARQAIFAAEDQANLRRLRQSEDARDELRAALAKFDKEVAEQREKIVAELNEAITEIGATYSAIQASRDLSSSCDIAFKRAMERITGV